MAARSGPAGPLPCWRPAERMKLFTDAVVAIALTLLLSLAVDVRDRRR